MWHVLSPSSLANSLTSSAVSMCPLKVTGLVLSLEQSRTIFLVLGFVVEVTRLPSFGVSARIRDGLAR